MKSGFSWILIKLCKIKDHVLNNSKEIKAAAGIQYKVNLLHRVVTKIEINKKSDFRNIMIF